jgi:hypothetical protein
MSKPENRPMPSSGMNSARLHALLSLIAAAILSNGVLLMPAQAQTRVFVAAQGSDANPCSFALPCRTFQHAHDTVTAGGEIDVLDPAGYGALTITKAISIQGHGFSGVSVAGGGTGIAINAGATDAISLNGLIIEGSGSGTFGVVFNSGRSLVVENCVVRNLTTGGLQFLSNSTSLQTLAVSKSYFSDIATDAMLVQAKSSGAVAAAIDRVAFYGNGHAGLAMNGVNGTGTISVAAADSVAGNNVVGFIVESDVDQSPATLTLTRTLVANNAMGVEAAGTNAILRLAQSTVVGNTIGYNVLNGGTVLSYGDNYIDANVGNVGSLGSASKQ